jgi:nuclear pore complex protein Nup205
VSTVLSVHVCSLVTPTLLFDTTITRRRTYKDVSEKWQLMEACLVHFELLIKLAQSAPWPSAARPPPGKELLDDFDKRGPVLHGILNLLHGGARRLEDERFQPHGCALERCVDRAIIVLLSAFGVHGGCAAAGQVHTAPSASRLDALLLRDPRRLVDLFSFVQYPHDAALQAATVRLVHVMALRKGHMPFELDETTLDHLKACMVDALGQALADWPTFGNTAQEISRLLLDTVQQPSVPNLGHLLLGFAREGPDGSLTLPRSAANSCLPLLVDTVATPLPAGAADELTLPELLFRERVLRILHTLAVDRHAGASAVAFVCDTLNLPALLAAASADGIATAGSSAQAALLHQRAWLLRLAAVVLHHPPSYGRAAELLRALFTCEAGSGAETPLLRLLASAVARNSAPAPLLEPAYKQMLGELGLVDVFAKSAGEYGSLYVPTERRDGEVSLDIIALDALMRQRAAEQRCVRALGALLFCAPRVSSTP